MSSILLLLSLVLIPLALGEIDPHEGSSTTVTTTILNTTATTTTNSSTYASTTGAVFMMFADWRKKRKTCYFNRSMDLLEQVSSKAVLMYCV
jgi:hypothetical protein